jgi:hypothetical protein
MNIWSEMARIGTIRTIERNHDGMRWPLASSTQMAAALAEWQLRWEVWLLAGASSGSDCSTVVCPSGDGWPGTDLD